MLNEMPLAVPAVCRIDDVIPDRAHRLKALGNAVVPAQGALAFSELTRRIS